MHGPTLLLTMTSPACIVDLMPAVVSIDGFFGYFFECAKRAACLVACSGSDATTCVHIFAEDVNQCYSHMLPGWTHWQLKPLLHASCTCKNDPNARIMHKPGQAGAAYAVLSFGPPATL